MQEKEHNSLNMFPELIREKKANRFRVFYMYVSQKKLKKDQLIRDCTKSSVQNKMSNGCAKKCPFYVIKKKKELLK